MGLSLKISIQEVKCQKFSNDFWKNQFVEIYNQCQLEFTFESSLSTELRDFNINDLIIEFLNLVDSEFSLVEFYDNLLEVF